jgi:multidrug efflux pump subunit AcrA (membrane-fusion protein)
MANARSAAAPVLVLSMVLLLSACQRAVEEPKPEIRPVRAITVEPRSNAGIVSLTGTVQAQTEINESFRIDGRLIERTVDIGDTVRPGQLIARLDPENEESGLQAARAGMAAARARRRNRSTCRRTGSATPGWCRTCLVWSRRVGPNRARWCRRGE